MASLADLIPLIAPEVPGANEATIRQACSYVARDFCKSTGVWRNDLSAISTTADVADYDLEPEVDDDDAASDDGTSYVEIVRLARVVLSGNELVEGDDYTYKGGVLHLNDTPVEDGDDDLAVTLILRPIYGGDYIDDTVLEENREALSYGALSRLMLQQKKPWTNMNAAIVYGRQYSEEVADTKVRVDAGVGAPSYDSPNIRSSLMIRMRRF